MNVRDANPTTDDWKLLMSHTDASLDGPTKESFNRAMHLFATNDDVNNHNRRCLLSLNHHIARSVATSLKGKMHVDADEEKMEAELLISVGARVMLTSNLWTDAPDLSTDHLGLLIQLFIIWEFHLQNLPLMF